MNYEWNLDILYKGLDDEKYRNDIEAVQAQQKMLHELVSNKDAVLDAKTVTEVLESMEKIQQLLSDLFNYLSLRKSVNTEDGDVIAQLSKMMRIASEGAADDAAAQKLLGSIENLDELKAQSQTIADYEFLIKDAKNKASHLMSNEEEALAAAMDATGGNAWSNLQSYLTSTVKVDYNGGVTTLSEIRDLANSADPAVRKAAYEAELAAYDKVKDSCAFALNNLKNQVIMLAEKRGYKSPLDEALTMSRMKRETLDAMMEAVEESMPVFRKYMRKKAEMLGYKNGLPWFELFAPMGECDLSFTVESCKDYLLKTFGPTLPEIADVMKEAFENEWIDFFPHSGKEGGAFDCGIASAKQSRILTNFTGIYDSVGTLAHELGHAFHDRQVQDQRPLNVDYPMPVAETASTFDEIFLSEEALKNAKGEEKLSLLESYIQGNTQCIVDIFSRYLFETAVFEQAQEKFLMADDLCEIMLEAQRKSYGDGMDDAFRHPYMWVCKGHYYISGLSFYNFPYTFGQLFATGLYALYKEDPQGFMPKYKEMLRTTPVHTIEEDGAMMGIDLTKKEFWKKSLKIVEESIQQFLAM